MNALDATFFDGKVSRGHPAQVNLMAEALHVTYTDADGTEHSTVWLSSETRQADWSPFGKVRLQYGSFPYQYLDLNFQEYEASVKPRYRGSRLTRVTAQSWVLERGFRALVGVLLLVLLAGWGLYAYILPGLAARAVSYLPEEQERELGRSLYEQMREAEAGAIDSVRSRQVSRYWQATGVRSRFPVTITVLQKDEINAFAVPGGHIVVYSGILDKMTRHEQLAALLAHETAHVEFRHSLKQLARNLATYAVLSVLIGDAGGLAGVLLENADELASLSYSRGDETEADAFAIQALAEKGIDPQGVVGLMKILPTEGDFVPTLLRTHPQTAERLQTAQERVKEVRFTPVANSRLPELWKAIRKTK